MTQVTDADREAAAEHAGYGGWGDGREHWLANALDSHPLIQAFARHREQAVQEAVAPLNARIAELEATAQNCPARHSMHGCPLAMIAAAKDQTL